MYLFLSSSDCNGSHPDNNAWDFTIDLQNDLYLNTDWECALMDINYNGDFGELYIYTDLCTPSYVNNAYLPLLRVINSAGQFAVPYFMRIPRNIIERIRIYIRSRRGQQPTLLPEHLTCTLQLRRKNGSY